MVLMKINLCRSMLAALLCPLMIAAAADETRTIPVQFKPGTTGADIKGASTGRESIVYTLGARSGQFLKVDLKTDNLSADFNVYIPGKGPGDDALYASALGDNSYNGQLFKDGEHKICVFLNRAAARRSETANFSLSLQITDKAPAPSPAAEKFSKTVNYGDIKFTVTFPAKPGTSEFNIASTGLTEADDTFNVGIEGKVIDVLCDDITGDDSPEVAVIVEANDGKRSAQVFTSYSKKSFGMVNFQDVTNGKALDGYRGGDEFQFVENTFVRRFPLYQGGEKTGKFRQFQFKMEDGEAMRQLKLDRTTNY